ncbi:MAG: peroxiredoxin family protein [Aureispira sp.]|nr:peroxiredoxin family protein [Aureispira sp.]
MNWIKSIFLSSFIALIILGGAWLGMNSEGFSSSFLWWGVLLNTLVVAGFFSIIFVKPKITVDRHLLPFSIPMYLGGDLAILSLFLDAELNYYGLGLSLVFVVGWLAYVYWYSRLDRHTPSLDVGKLLPKVGFENPQGEKVSSNDFVGQPTVWLFYRGNWCPLCMMQIKEIAASYKEIEKIGAKVALVSPQPHKFTKSLAQKHEVNFDFLVDVENKAAQQLGIAHDGGLPTGLQALGYASDTVLPTVIICDAEGKIVYRDLTENYRIRPEPQDFLEVLNKL